MGLRSPQAYRESLRDGRTVYFHGEKVESVPDHPELRDGVEHVALDFRLAQDRHHKDLFTVVDPETGEVINRYFLIPRTPDDLLRRREMIEAGTREGKSVVSLVKEIGTDALFALTILSHQMDARLGTSYAERVARYLHYCKTNDLAMAVAQTDVKGDRSLRPWEQANPDVYVHVVEERSDGIVVRGAKAHTTNAVFANEIIVLPTRAMSEKDRNYAVAFAVPAHAEGLVLIASGDDHRGSEFTRPISARHRMIESLTIFDDVFVPWDRVFLCGEWAYAGPLAKTFVDFHRFTAVSYKPPLLELFVGGAALMAEYNGIERAEHVREKLSRLIMYLETVRGLTKAAALDCKIIEGVAVPNVVYTNACKHYFASNYHQMIQYVQDIAGGLLVTEPSGEDWRNPETRAYLEHYLGGKASLPTEHRLRTLHLLRDIAASDFGGYLEVLAIHAEGSLQAQLLTVLREFDVEGCKRYAREIAGIPT